MTDKYKALRVALELGPTKGPWTVSDDHGKRWIGTLHDDDSICQVIRRDKQVGQQRDIEFIANTNLIAACDPDTICNLLAERDAQAAEIERLRSALEDLVRDNDDPMDAATTKHFWAQARTALAGEQDEN